MVNIQQFLSLLRAQIETIAPDKLQRVPLCRIVTGCDCDASIRFVQSHGQLETRGRTNSQVDDLTTRREQSSDNRRSNHRPGWSCIPTDKDAAAGKISGKGLREPDCHFRCKRLTDNATHTRDPNLERLHNEPTLYRAQGAEVGQKQSKVAAWLICLLRTFGKHKIGKKPE
jgi:hypothetical protein